jgi:TonB family protein
MPSIRLLIAALAAACSPLANAVVVPDAAGYAAAVELGSQEIKRAEADPAYPTWKLLRSYSSVMSRATLAGRPAVAVELGRRQVALAERKGTVVERISALQDLVGVLVWSGAAAEAVEPGRRALALSELEYGLAGTRTLLHLGNLLEVYIALGRLESAAPLVRQGLQVAGDLHGPSVAKSQFYDTAANYYRARGEMAEAAKLLANAPQQRAAFANTFVPDPPSRTAVPVDGACKQVYPDEARTYGLEGEVKADIRVGRDGIVKGVALSRSSGWAVLDKAAVAGFAKCQFTPAERDGLRIADDLAMEYRWVSESPARAVPIPGTCAWGDSFIALEARQPAAIRIRFKVGANGKVDKPVIEYSQAPDRVNALALRLLKACRYKAAGAGSAWLDWKG